jgi:FAD binding domain
MASARASQQAFFGVSALLCAASAVVTIVWCASMSAMGEMPMRRSAGRGSTSARSLRGTRMMNRRQLLRGAAAVSVIATGCSSARDTVQPFRRVRPTDPSWPSEASWDRLRRAVGGRFIKVESPLAACRSASQATVCAQIFDQLKNPYHIGDHPALTQTAGWVDGWTSAPSVYAVAAAKTADVVAVVKFARDHRLRLVVKGGGHSYQGTSCSADSLLIWTRAMNGIVLHDAFVPQGCVETLTPQPAVTVGAGATWMDVYDAVTTRAGRYVQGGGCTTVGVAGLIQSGGFGSFSKNYGLAAAGLRGPENSRNTLGECSGQSRPVRSPRSAG